MGTPVHADRIRPPAPPWRLKAADLVAHLDDVADTATLGELLRRLGDEAESHALLYSLPPGFLLDRLPNLLVGLRDAAYRGDLAAAAALVRAARSPIATPACYVTRGVLSTKHLTELSRLLTNSAAAAPVAEAGCGTATGAGAPTRHGEPMPGGARRPQK